MKGLIAAILLLMLFSAARAETPEYFNTDTQDATVVYYVNPEGGQRFHAVADCPSISAKYYPGMLQITDEQLVSEYSYLIACQICGAVAPSAAIDSAVQPKGTPYIVGVDLQQGLYSFFAADDCTGTMTVTNWDGSINDQQAIEPGWYETMRIYNEQTVYLPEGAQGEFHMSFLSSDYDTGTRQLRITEPGTYSVGKELTQGLYIVQNNSEENSDVRVLGGDGAVLHTWSLVPDARYTIWLGEGGSAEIGQGCMLRSMTTQWLFQEGTEATVAQGRFSTRMQIPGRVYTLTGRDYTSYVAITSLADGETTRQYLASGQTWMLNTMELYDEEWLVEMVNVDVQWENGEG